MEGGGFFLEILCWPSYKVVYLYYVNLNMYVKTEQMKKDG
jgi:hypothetical protein